MSEPEWVELDRVQWLHDHLRPDTADALARLITEDDPHPAWEVP